MDPRLLAELRARREQAHKEFYFAPISGPYEKGLMWGILCTLDDVLDRVTGGQERLDRSHRYQLEQLTDTWTGRAH